MAIKLVDELQAMGNFPIAHAEGINLVKEDGTEDNLQNLFNNGELGGGGDSSITLTQAEYEALPEEEKLNGLYYTYDTKRIYKNGVQYGASEPIPLTMEEYKALKAAGAIDEKQEYLVEADAEGILLGAEDIGYNNAVSGIQATTVQGAIDKVAEKADGLILDTDLTSTTSTLSANKIRSAVVHSFNTQDGSVKYVKFKPSVTAISVADIYGGKIEILGASKSVSNPDYKTVKVVRLSYGDWGSYDATQVPSVVHTKIGELYYYPTDEYYYLKLYNYASFTMTGLATAPELVTSLPAEESAMTLIPESDWGKIDDTTSSTEKTWSSSKIASEISPKADKQSNIKNTDYLKSDRPYLKISRNGNLNHVSYYTCETYILCSHNGDMGALNFIRNDDGASCVYKNIVGTLPLSVEKYDEYTCWLKYSSTASEIYTVYALNGYKPTVSAVTSTT